MYYLPFHDNEQTAMSHEHILVDILKIDDVLVGAGPPVKIHLPTGFGDISKDLEGAHVTRPQ